MTVPFALSIHSFVNSVGAYVGLASIVAVAILTLLYFAHARETATVRDRLDEAQQRISGLEARIGALLQMQQRGRPGPPAPVTPAPVGPRPLGAPQGSVRRVPNPATAAAAATSAPAPSAPPAAGLAQAAVQPRQSAGPAAPAGVAGPALASATKVIPDPAVTGAPDDTMFVPASAAANGKAGSEHTAVLASATAAASARVASASPRGAVAAPPRMQIGAEQETTVPPTTAGGASRVRRIGGHPKPAVVPLPVFDDESVGGGRFSGAMLPLLIVGIAVVVIVAGLVVITNSGGSTPANVHKNASTGTTGQSLHKKQTAPAPFSPSKVTVAVLNGTAQQGLAGDVGKKLADAGFKQGNVTNAASQTDGHTFVYFVKTKANQTAARHVAKALALPPSRVRHAGARVIQSCTISATGASLGSCGANVIVSVGQDRVNLASG
ncbi:MAG: LytR C-terminal domain-containing protein [Solirubrobacteraceae bacterium]